jgi:hypothetical protein
MTTPEKTAVASHIAVVTLAGVAIVCLVGLTAAGLKTLDGVNETLAEINAPCTSFHGSVSCGPIAQLSQTEKDVGILAAQGALQVKQTHDLILATTRNLDEVGASVKKVSGHLSQTADALSETAQQASTSVQGVETHLTPVLDSTAGALDAATGRINALADTQTALNRSIDHADALITNPTIPETLANVQNITAQTAIITTDAKVYEERFVYPPLTPWYKKILPTTLKFGELAYDFVR